MLLGSHVAIPGLSCSSYLIPDWEFTNATGAAVKKKKRKKKKVTEKKEGGYLKHPLRSLQGEKDLNCDPSNSYLNTADRLRCSKQGQLAEEDTRDSQGNITTKILKVGIVTNIISKHLRES